MKKVTTAILVAAATLSLASLAFAQNPQLNEIVRNDVSTDDHEFVEICAAPGTDLTGYSIVEIEGDGSSNTGTIDRIHNMSGIVGPSGFFTVTRHPANITCADETWVGGNDMENGGATFLLVLNMTGVVGQDIDANDDGVADGPIGTVVDAVGMGRPSQGDLFGYYGAVQVGPDTGDDGTADFDPAAVARCEDCTGVWNMICLNGGTEPTAPGCDTNVYLSYASPCSGNLCGPVAVDEQSWGETKALYK